MNNEVSVLENSKDITRGINPPKDACATYQLRSALLKEFQDELHLTYTY